MATTNNNNNNNSVDNQKQSPLFSLPPEVRNMIYELHLSQPTLRGNPGPLVLDDPLLYTCQLICQEALTIHQASVPDNLLVETRQRCTTSTACMVGCSSPLVLGDRLIMTLGRARVATLPQVGELFLSPARVAVLHQGWNPELGSSTTRMQTLAGIGALPQPGPFRHPELDEMVEKEANWQAMVTALMAMGFVLSAVRTWDDYGDNENGENFYTWYVQFV